MVPCLRHWTNSDLPQWFAEVMCMKVKASVDGWTWFLVQPPHFFFRDYPWRGKGGFTNKAKRNSGILWFLAGLRQCQRPKSISKVNMTRQKRPPGLADMRNLSSSRRKGSLRCSKQGPPGESRERPMLCACIRKARSSTEGKLKRGGMKRCCLFRRTKCTIIEAFISFLGMGNRQPFGLPVTPRYGIRMRVHDRYRQAQSRSAKQKSKRTAL